jgi:hypothetical protein
MKNLIPSLLILTFVLHACKDDKKTDTPAAAKSMSGKVEGNSWTANEINAIYLNEIFVLTGKSSNGSSIVIRVQLFPGNEATIPYTLTYDDMDNAGIYMENATDPAFSTNQWDGSKPFTGKLTFTKFDKSTKTVSGTFNLDVKRAIDGETRTITGSFTNVVYSDKLPPTPGKTMTAKVDGVFWSASNVTAVEMSITESIGIVGNASNSTSMTLYVPDDATVGTHNVERFGDYMAQYNPTSSTFLYGESGTINITEHDIVLKVIKGTFSFKASDGTDEKEITAGNFVASY